VGVKVDVGDDVGEGVKVAVGVAVDVATGIQPSPATTPGVSSISGSAETPSAISVMPSGAIMVLSNAVMSPR
jgi:hypothetical protein